MFFNKTENRIIGLLFDINGEQFTIEEVTQKYSKYLSKAYEKTNVNPQRELIIKNHNTAYEPHEIIEIKLDLRKSSQLTNEALIEYLQFAGQINGLVQKSIINIETIFFILNNPSYNNKFTKGYILIHQDVFDSQSFLDELNYMEKIKLYTENRYRNNSIMERYKEDFNKNIYEMFKSFLIGENIDISESPSVLRNSIMSTANEYYNKEIGFMDEKDNAFNAIKQIESDITHSIEVINTMKDAISKHKIVNSNWKELKDDAMVIVDNLLKESTEKQDELNKKKNIVKYFPK